MKKMKKLYQTREDNLTMKQAQKLLSEIKGGLNSTLKFIILPVWLHNS